MTTRKPRIKRAAAPASAPQNTQPDPIVISTTDMPSETTTPVQVPIAAEPVVTLPPLQPGYIYTQVPAPQPVQAQPVVTPKLAVPRLSIAAIAPWVIVAFLGYALLGKVAPVPPGPGPAPAPAPGPLTPDTSASAVKSIKELFQSDVAGMKFYAALSSRIADIVELDGKSSTPRLTTTDQLMENFHADIGRYVNAGNSKSVTGLGAFLTSQFNGDVPAGKLDASARDGIVKKWRFLADAFEKASK